MRARTDGPPDRAPSGDRDPPGSPPAEKDGIAELIDRRFRRRRAATRIAGVLAGICFLGLLGALAKGDFPRDRWPLGLGLVLLVFIALRVFCLGLFFLMESVSEPERRRAQGVFRTGREGIPRSLPLAPPGHDPAPEREAPGRDEPTGGSPSA